MKRIFFICLILAAFTAMQAQVDRTKAPKAGPAPTINLSDYQSFTLANGLKVFVVENHKLPVVSVSLLLAVPPLPEGENVGYTEAAGMLLRTGTVTKTKAQLDEAIDKIGAHLTTSQSSLYATGLKKHVTELFDITADIILHSEFREPELDKIKQMMISDYAQSKEEPDAIAGRVKRRVYYGENHPFGVSETEKSIKSITLDMCKQYYQSYFRPNIGYMAIVGDISLPEAKALVEKHFSGWAQQELPSYKIPTPTAPLVTKVAIVDRDNAVQSVVNVGYPVSLKPGEQGAIAASVMNTILGGGTFRLFNNLREAHGYTYGAYSQLNPNPYIGNFTASASVRNEVTDSAITQFLYEMKRIRTEPVEQKELDLVKNYITGNFSISLENPETIANFAISTERYNLPKDYYKNYLKNLAAVNQNDVLEAAKKYILPEQSHIVVVGKAADIAGKLKAFTVAGKIDYYDIDGNKIDPTVSKVPQGITAQNVIDNYIKALGGKENILKVKDRVTVMSGKIPQMNADLSITVYQKAPNLYMIKQSVMNMESTMLFDGKKAISHSPMGDKEITGSDLEEVQFQADMTGILTLDKNGITTRLAGVQKINSEDAYKIEFTLAGGSKVTSYFSIATGLKLREEKTVSTPNGTITQITDESDYRDVKGLKYPFKIKQTAGNMSVEMTVTKIDVNSKLSKELFK